MASKIITGAVAFREKRGGTTEWFLVKPSDSKLWELPKSDVRGGESSVSAILRYLKEGLGVKAMVLEEAGRANSTLSNSGTQLEQKLIFYLMRQSKSVPEDGLPIASSIKVINDWFPYSSVKKKLGLVREQKMVVQANNILKEWKKIKGKKVH